MERKIDTFLLQRLAEVENVELLGQVLTLLEGKKVQVSRGNMREVLARLSDITFILGDEKIGRILYNNGKNRAKKRKKA